MKRRFLPTLVLLLSILQGQAQEDSLDVERLEKMVILTEVAIRTDLNVARFIQQVKNDSTFYKAFRNLHVLGCTAWNDIRIKDKKGKNKASLQSKTRQLRSNNCRTMEVLEEHTTGDFYNTDHQI